MDAECEAEHPQEAQDLEDPVGEHDLLGRAAAALVDDQRVAQHGEHERHDRELEPEVVADLGGASRTPRGSTP